MRAAVAGVAAYLWHWNMQQGKGRRSSGLLGRKKPPGLSADTTLCVTDIGEWRACAASQPLAA
jgi:hypothetical protein